MKQLINMTVGIIILLTLSCLVFAFLIAYQFYITSGVILALIIVEVLSLFRLMERNNRMFTQFIWSIRYSEFQTSYATSKSTADDNLPKELTEAMKDALVHYREHLQQKESQLQYFQALANHIDLAVIVFTSSGKIEWTNLAAQLQTGIQFPETIDDLHTFHTELPSRLRELRAGDLSILQVNREEETYQLTLSGMSFVIQGKKLTVASMKNIRTALENKETETWQKLIRVLTHEIMNSMTPIVSLSELLNKRFTCRNQTPEENQEEVGQAIETIFRRSSGLLRFVENYRKVAGIPIPILQAVSVADLLNNIGLLFITGVSGLSISHVSAHLQIIADRNLIEQVLINLIKNAKEATSEYEQPQIIVTAGINADGRIHISVSDNGPGISTDVMERIFIPFFTTKPSGSGIGLSISRQIMHMHHGSLTNSPNPLGGSRFTLTFPK